MSLSYHYKRGFQDALELVKFTLKKCKSLDEAEKKIEEYHEAVVADKISKLIRELQGMRGDELDFS